LLRRRLFVLLLGLILVATTSHADVRLPRLLSNGAILQRDVPATLWGWADEAEVVAVYLDGTPMGDATTVDGQWTIEIPTQSAGGPHQVRVTGNNTVTIDDVWFGDIWIASGQSNMQIPMERVKERYPEEIAAANYPLIREFEVPRTFDYKKPRADFDGGYWKLATPESVMTFSAVGYFFAKSIHEHHGVPVGIVSSNYGGASAEGWMSEQALKAYPHYLEVAIHNRDDEWLQAAMAADQTNSQTWSSYVDVNDAGLRESPAWMAAEYDDSKWQTMSVPGYWADTSTGPVNGVVWFRKTFELPATAAGKPGKLMLGRIIDADTAYINGVQVGNTTYQYPPRRYEVAADILRPGKNTIAVRVVSSAGKGGFVLDKPYWLRVDDTTVDLRGEWRLKVGVVSEPMKPQQFVVFYQPLGFYNAMLAPLLNMRIKGVIWYQGESNVGRAEEYADLLPALIRDWRTGWQQGDFPFVYAQLPNYLEAQEAPQESAWAEMREAQRLALRVRNTAMAVAIDLGEWNDIHPLNKSAVGERLALAARSLAYGETDLVSSGPLFQSMEAQGDRLIVHFDYVGSGLVAHGDRLGGFAVAGADRVFHWANAKVAGDTVVISSADGEQPIYLRYAWADNPESANLYNVEGLPASPFQATTLH
jgi:sialate O-acetylesterase